MNSRGLIPILAGPVIAFGLVSGIILILLSIEKDGTSSFFWFFGCLLLINAALAGYGMTRVADTDRLEYLEQREKQLKAENTRLVHHFNALWGKYHNSHAMWQRKNQHLRNKIGGMT